VIRRIVIRLPHLSVFRELLRRELGERYRGTLLGGGWYLVLPLLQLAVLAWVFGSLLPARANTSAPYAVFLALGLWPWSVFANAAARSATVLVDNASLLGKIAVPHEVYVHARVASSVIVDLAGFLAVLVVVILFGVRFDPAGIPAALAGLAVMLVFALGLSRLLRVLPSELGGARPKSSTRMRSSLPNITLAGLKSRWTRLRLCAAARPRPASA